MDYAKTMDIRRYPFDFRLHFKQNRLYYQYGSFVKMAEKLGR